MQIAAGAIGVTCAKLGEAEVMAAAGIRDILIANQIVGSDKIGRLVRLAEQADPLVCVDSIENLIELDAAFGTLGKPLRVAIEVNIGMNRAGIEPGPSVAAFAQEIANRPGLRLVGVVGWESQATTIADPAEKERTVRNAVAALTASARACVAAGHGVAVVSCGGTGTFPYCAQQPGVTEVQIGGAIFSDMHYLTNYHVDFAPALTVLTTVTSRPTPTRIVVDAGRKSMSGDAAMPRPLGISQIKRNEAVVRARENRTAATEHCASNRRQDRVDRRLLGYHGASARGNRGHPRRPRRIHLARCRAWQGQVAVARSFFFAFFGAVRRTAILTTLRRCAHDARVPSRTLAVPARVRPERRSSQAVCHPRRRAHAGSLRRTS